MRNRLIMDKIQKRIVGAVAAEEELKDAIILTKTFGHKTLEERSAEFGGNLNLDGEYDWGESVGKEVW